MKFDPDIRKLFRESDRLDMEFMFDLWDYEDVKENAQNILNRLADHTMPCDGPWPDEKIEVFESWIANGCQR